MGNGGEVIIGGIQIPHFFCIYAGKVGNADRIDFKG
ncbi:hypothetical protein Xbed_00478 [Xenorhabdus beddingii]|uniref:Uncharacterized protein n=1 Tax=Xenorhabdus beddingii TaxID=40578 RepID=A0A1Y2STM9_9GAMM|nr:hypothetical protein Xbed_00478 [Xenorhabdus beddingii]